MPKIPEFMPSLAWRRFWLVMLCAAIGFVCGTAAFVAATFGVMYWYQSEPLSPRDVLWACLIGGIPGTINGLIIGIPVSFLVLKKPVTSVWPWLLVPALATAILVAHSLGVVGAWLFSSMVFLVAASLLASSLRDLPVFAKRACRHCGYSLEGLPGNTCPECGRASTSEPDAH